MTSGSAKNALGQEVFGSKAPETPVVESPAASVVDVTSAATGVGTMAVPEADKAGTSVPPTIEGGATTVAPLFHSQRRVRGGSSTKAWSR
jgi:hypothetical protein